MNEWRFVHSTFQSCRWIKFWLSSTTNACTAITHIADARTDSAFDIRCVQSLSLLLNSASYAVTFHRSLYTDEDDDNQFKLLSVMFVCTKISSVCLPRSYTFFSKAVIFILRDQHLKFFFIYLFVCLLLRFFVVDTKLHTATEEVHWISTVRSSWIENFSLETFHSMWFHSFLSLSLPLLVCLCILFYFSRVVA